MLLKMHNILEATRFSLK